MRANNPGIKELHLFLLLFINYQQKKKMSKEYSPIISVEQSAPAYDEDVRSENDFGIMSDEEADSDDCDE